MQIGIKHYDRSFWNHVAEILEVKELKSFYQELIGKSFINTLSINNKLLLNKSERVYTILMHGFVSDYYANDMFEFLFKYYNIDLERDLQRNDREMMNSLFEVIKRNDNTGRTYLLVKQTANALSKNVRGGKIRIRWLLRLIDKCFWEQITPVNPVSRLSILFNRWQENSNEFKLQYNKYHNNYTYGGGKKSYLSPYLQCDFFNTTFKLILPTQLIKFEFEKDVKWNIYYKEQQITLDTFLYEAVTGYKTETEEIKIKAEDLFNGFTIELTYHDERIRLFKIKADCIRFFDKNGDYLNVDNSLPKGEVYAFTNIDEIPHSEALVESEYIGDLIRSYFKFEYGDVVRLPDGKAISIGKKIDEGLLYRKSLSGAYALKDNAKIPIYCESPSILLKILAKRANGTVININGIRHRLFDHATTVIELGDRSGETGYIFNLGDYGCTADGLYTVFVDVPNDRTNRFWQFVLINGIRYTFEDAPYIFKLKGTIRFNEELLVHTQDSTIEKNSDENSFNFMIQPDVDDLQFVFQTKNEVIDLSFPIPALKWKFDKEPWNVEKPVDFWYSDFPTVIYIKYPAEKIKISMDEQVDVTNVFEEQTVAYEKLKAKGFFECDTTRFKSWFGREKIIRSVFLDLPGKRTEFMRVITQSIVEVRILKGNLEAGVLIGEFDIIGNANYYVDVMIPATKKILAEKLPLIDGKFEIAASLGSGLYKVSVFEDEKDDTGFGLVNYIPIGEFEHDLINPSDLRGKSIALKYIKKIGNNMSRMSFNCKYYIHDLKRSNDDIHNYQGTLLIDSPFGKSPIAYAVNVCINDLNKLQEVCLTFYDGYDFLELLYDTYRKFLVKEEEKGLRRAVRYRRYESIYPEDYVYVVEFIREISSKSILEKPAGDFIEMLNISGKSVEEICRGQKDLELLTAEELTVEQVNNLTDNQKILSIQQEAQTDFFDTALSEIGLSMIVVNYLKRANVFTIRDIVEKGIKKLSSVQGLNKKMCKEIIDKLYSLGISLR